MPIFCSWWKDLDLDSWYFNQINPWYAYNIPAQFDRKRVDACSQRGTILLYDPTLLQIFYVQKVTQRTISVVFIVSSRKADTKKLCLCISIYYKYIKNTFNSKGNCSQQITANLLTFNSTIVLNICINNITICNIIKKISINQVLYINKNK